MSIKVLQWFQPGKSIRKSFKCYVIVAAISFIMCVFVFINRRCVLPTCSFHKVLEDVKWSSGKADTSSTKYILFYTNFWHYINWRLPSETVGPEYFRQNNCPVTDCWATTNRKLLVELTDYDVLVFHMTESWIQSGMMQGPAVRSPKQIYVAATAESPPYILRMVENDVDFYNWTMSYRLDSDIRWYYLKFISLKSGLQVSPTEDPRWEPWNNSYRNELLLAKTDKKTKIGAQFSSKCVSFSNRETLIERIRKLMEIDVYGKCGDLQCPRRSEECDKMLEDNYWFYFAFENSLCKDYISEKLYRSMRQFIVPVVFGGADYAKFAPPHSYINVEDFESVEKLVEYLQYLVKNPVGYVKYFWWREHYKVVDTAEIMEEPLCEMCKKLHDVDGQQKVQYYRNIKAWWFAEVCRKETKIKF
ncbi:alpha-(1,3)-fucosyltransferase C-like [Uranotaenia lowii]|uniref:alpha-(1,3)-fucosyltransferase C-like n=1 Tax=Uranotaenia lowii TaxID=190385 RepID=UPI00247B092E|nr:alpha-(1,3)-fucosyltransferase C-like [Uranotaenia lowii]